MELYVKPEILRNPNGTDVEDLAQLSTELVYEGKDVERSKWVPSALTLPHLEKKIAQGDLVAIIRKKSSSRIVATATLHFVALLDGTFRGQIEEVITLGAHQRHGLADVLWKFLRTEARKYPCKHVDLLSNKENSKRWWQKREGLEVRLDTMTFRDTLKEVF